MNEDEAGGSAGSAADRNPLFEDGGPLADPLERRAIFAALDSFRQYRKTTHYNTTHRRRQNLYALPSAQWQMLAAPPISLLDTLSAVDDAIDCNADLADAIYEVGLASFGLSDDEETPSSTPTKQHNPGWNWHGKAKPNDISKAQSTIRQFYRDWTAQGFALEVQPLLNTILADLETYLPIRPKPRPDVDTTATESHDHNRNHNSNSDDFSSPPSLLLPGAGLGRILFELCLHGYSATGNEISYHQLLASNFILNCTRHADQFAIYPFAHSFTNVVSRENQLKRFTVPDVHPATAMAERARARARAQGARAEQSVRAEQSARDEQSPTKSQTVVGERQQSQSQSQTDTEVPIPVGEMNMTAGDFVLSYSGPDTANTFDGVVSVFFIDTAPNLIRYIETVKNCLKQGGYWINVGPLLWHFDDRGPATSQSKSTSSTSGRKGAGDATTSNDSDDDDDDDDEEIPNPNDSKDSKNYQDKGIAEPGSFELSVDEVLHLVSTLGFEIQRHEIITTSTTSTSTSASSPAHGHSHGSGLGYMQDPESLLQNRYRCSHWVARKL
ncbi:hypothetical protein ABEF95_016544 [Exophiala dermatitidis]